MVGPSEWLGHGVIEIVDEVHDFQFQVVGRGEIAASNHFTSQDREPNLNLVQPGTMFGCVVKNDWMIGVTQKGGARRDGLENAALTFDAEIAHVADLLRHQPDQGF